MDDQVKQEKKAEPKVEDLPSKVTPNEAEKIKGGSARRGGDEGPEETGPEF